MECVSTGMGKRVKEAREVIGLTAMALAEALAISESYMGLLERDDRTPSIKVLKKLCAVLGVTMDYLIYGNPYDDQSDTAKIIINENQISMTESDSNWPVVDREISFGIAVGKILKPYNLDDESLSFILAAIKQVAKTQKRKAQDLALS